jgi:hypothetical protein
MRRVAVVAAGHVRDRAAQGGRLDSVLDTARRSGPAPGGETSGLRAARGHHHGQAGRPGTAVRHGARDLRGVPRRTPDRRPGTDSRVHPVSQAAPGPGLRCHRPGRGGRNRVHRTAQRRLVPRAGRHHQGARPVGRPHGLPPPGRALPGRTAPGRDDRPRHLGRPRRRRLRAPAHHARLPLHPGRRPPWRPDGRRRHRRRRAYRHAAHRLVHLQ